MGEVSDDGCPSLCVKLFHLLAAPLAFTPFFPRLSLILSPRERGCSSILGKKWLEKGRAGAEEALRTGRKREESGELDVHQGFERRLHGVTFLFQAFMEQYQNRICHK